MKKFLFTIIASLLFAGPLSFVHADTPPPAAPPAAPPASGPGSNPPTGDFVPLEANSPLVTAEKAAAQPGGTTAGLLSALYNICVGIAVVLAVLQLTRAGITYMLSDSITNKEQARHLIMTSVLGLLLVLSPVIVFSIINPDILTFNLNLDALKVVGNGSINPGGGTFPNPKQPGANGQTGGATGTW